MLSINDRYWSTWLQMFISTKQHTCSKQCNLFQIRFQQELPHKAKFLAWHKKRVILLRLCGRQYSKWSLHQQMDRMAQLWKAAKGYFPNQHRIKWGTLKYCKQQCTAICRSIYWFSSINLVTWI